MNSRSSGSASSSTSKAVSVIQYDTNRVGGVTAAQKINALAEAYQVPVIPHAGQMHNYHLTMANVNCPISEYFPIHDVEIGNELFYYVFKGDVVATGGYLDLEDTKPGSRDRDLGRVSRPVRDPRVSELMTKQVYSGVWPVAPTPFNEDGTLDLDGMRRVLDCIIDQGSTGVCLLANYSEQFLLSDEERETLTRLCLEHIAGRVPVIVTISHFATDVVVSRARRAAEQGASIVMMMAPYHGALLRGTPEQTFEQFLRAGEAGLPIMVQDAPLSGVDLPVPLLVRMAREIEMVKLFKIECAGAAAKLRALIAEGGDAIEGPFDGEEGITLLADLDAGATGNMCSAMLPDLIKPVVEAHARGDRSSAVAGYTRIPPAINHENRQCGFRAAKAAMQEGG